MPHCIIEYSHSDIDVKALLKAVHAGASNSNLFEVHDIKVRAMGFDHYFVASDTETMPDFIHVSTRLLSGRTDEEKLYLSNCILSAVCQSLTWFTGSVTVEILDIDRHSYSKKVTLEA